MTIIHKAIEPDPQARYQTAGELADDLRRFLSDEPIRARRVSLIERWLRWSRRNKRLAMALAMLASVLLVTAVTSAIVARHFRILSNDLSLAVGDLNSANGQLSVSRDAAMEAKNDALKSRDEMDTARREAQEMVADLHTERGLLAAGNNDPALAALWFANGARHATHDAYRESVNRLRARNALLENPLPCALLKPPSSGTKFSSLAFQPHGRFLLAELSGAQRNSAELNSGVAIFDVLNEQPLGWTTELKNSSAAIWLPGGQRVAIGFSTGEVQIRDVLDGRVIRTISATGPIKLLAYSSEGKWLACGSQVVQVWKLDEPPTREHEWTHSAPMNSLFFNRSGTRLVTASSDGHARVYAVGKPPRSGSSATAATSLISEPLFAPVPHEQPYGNCPPLLIDDDRKLITMSNQRPAHLGWWDAETGADVTPASLPAVVDWSLCLAGHPDGRSFMVGGLQGCWVIDVTGSHLKLPHPHEVRFAVFSRNGKSLWTTSLDWQMREWMLAAPTTPQHTLPHLQDAYGVRVTDDGELMAAMGPHSVRVWQQPASAVIAGQTEGWDDVCWRPRPSHDMRLATQGRWHESMNNFSNRSHITVIETATGAAVGPTISLPEIVDSCVLDDGATVAVVSQQKQASPSGTTTGWLSLFDIASGRRPRAPITLTSPPCSVAVRPAAQDVAVLCEDGSLFVIDVRDNSIRLSLKHSDWGTWSSSYSRNARVTFSPDGRSLITVKASSEIAVRDADSGTERYAAIAPNGYLRTISISPDSRWLATGVNGLNANALRVWDLVTGKALCEPIAHPGDHYGIHVVQFSPDARLVAVAHKDGLARLWDWQAGQLVCPPLPHPNEVMDIAFLPDGRHFATVTRLDTVRIAESLTGKLIASPLKLPRSGEAFCHCLAVTTDRILVTAPVQPVLNVAELIEPPALSTTSLRALAEVVSGMELTLSERSSFAVNDWESRWASLDAKSLSLLRHGTSIGSEAQSIRLAQDILREHPTEWHMLQVETVQSPAGATFTPQADQSLLVSGKNELGDRYRITATTTANPISVIQLEVLPDPSLPNQGPGRHPSGNFQVQAFRVFVESSADNSRLERIDLNDAWASYQHHAPAFVDVEALLQEEPQKVWHIWGQFGKRHAALFRLAKPVTLSSEQRIVIEIVHHHGTDVVNLGRFRLSVSSDQAAIRKERLH